MALFQCKMCGGSLEVQENTSVATCVYCGTKQTVPQLSDEKRVQLYDRASYFRRGNEFDKAMGIYEMILSEDHEDAEAYWSLVLCRYGIEYVEDPATHKRVPTVNRTQRASVFDDLDYQAAMRYADAYQSDVYAAEAQAIDAIQKDILAVSAKEEPFDIFICYKETDSSGSRTQDSVYAQDIYNALVKEGYRVFFSRITLEDKLGTAYEPYIFAALNSAKVMLVVGTSQANLNAVWVKNEWSRYLHFMQKDKGKTLIPVYKDISPYELPEEFAYLQAQDMSKIGFLQDLLHGIQKLLYKPTKQADIVLSGHSGSAEAEALLKRAFIFLDDGSWENADTYAEKVLDQQPENARAYFVKYLSRLHIHGEEELASTPRKFNMDDANLKKAFSFADDAYKTQLQASFASAAKRYDELAEKVESIYAKDMNGEYEEEDFETCQLAADNSNPLACLIMGRVYKNGCSYCTADRKLSFRYFSKSTLSKHSGLAEALYEVGMHFMSQKMYDVANRNFLKSASLEYPLAEYMLGLNYCLGKGVEKNQEKGMQYFQSAVQGGSIIAHLTIGDAYFNGLYGCVKNLQMATKYYNVAINASDYKADQSALAILHRHLGGAYLHLSRCYQQQKEYKKALEVLEEGAEKGFSDCYSEIGLFYEVGIGLPADKTKALFWYDEGAKRRDALSMYKMGCFYEIGDGISKDVNKAVLYFSEAAKKGVPMANYKMGTYAEANQNYKSAVTYYEKAAEKKIALAYNALGVLYEKGHVGKRSKEDMNKALTYYKKAADMGMAIAQNNVGAMYYNHGNRDYERAYPWFKKAADQGYEPAKQNCEMVLNYVKSLNTADKLNRLSKFLNRF